MGYIFFFDFVYQSCRRRSAAELDAGAIGLLHTLKPKPFNQGTKLL
jgi:hypothetical protein